VLSASTIDHFCEFIEWAAEQEWSSGKVGLLGISYYAAIQWKVAARQPKGLVAAIPWEGFGDLYRDGARHGGILSNAFFDFWWPRQVESNQYGLPGRAARNWGDDTIEGDLSPAELAANRVDLLDRLPKLRYRDQDWFESVNLDLENITIPILSVANWGGYLLHLRGNVQGFIHAGSSLKYLRFIAGRHDLPFYYAKEVELQRSFLDAFLKNDDRVGWSRKGEVPPVSLVLRKGDVGFNDPEAEDHFQRRDENEWPIARTQYTRFYLHPDGTLESRQPSLDGPSKCGYLAPGDGQPPSLVSFTTPCFTEEVEITGHIVAHLNVSMTRLHEGPTPSDIDLFVTLRHVSPKGNEVLYTGTVGDPIPVTKGFLRLSLRKVNRTHPDHQDWLPHRDYDSSDVQPVIPGDVYAVDVELWPTNVVVDVGGRLVFEVSSGDTAGTGLFHHNNAVDRYGIMLAHIFHLYPILTGARPRSVFEAENYINFGPKVSNYITLPIIPSIL
jgi:predicted acyl esterase